MTENASLVYTSVAASGQIVNGGTVKALISRALAAEGPSWDAATGPSMKVGEATPALLIALPLC